MSLSASNSWMEKNDELIKEFVFSDFVQAIDFVNQVKDIAEEQAHHPRITINYNKVLIETCTHDAGNVVTDKDRRLAESLDSL